VKKLTGRSDTFKVGDWVTFVALNGHQVLLGKVVGLTEKQGAVKYTLQQFPDESGIGTYTWVDEKPDLTISNSEPPVFTHSEGKRDD
jgi:hypothetical protein